MDLDFPTYIDLFNHFSGAMDLIFSYLVDFLGSAEAAEKAIITEDMIVE
ncbi:MAG: hypothetical protein AAGF87_09940 [Bacteroidota bacterium]